MRVAVGRHHPTARPRRRDLGPPDAPLQRQSCRSARSRAWRFAPWRRKPGRAAMAACGASTGAWTGDAAERGHRATYAARRGQRPLDEQHRYTASLCYPTGRGMGVGDPHRPWSRTEPRPQRITFQLWAGAGGSIFDRSADLGGVRPLEKMHNCFFRKTKKSSTRGKRAKPARCRRLMPFRPRRPVGQRPPAKHTGGGPQHRATGL